MNLVFLLLLPKLDVPELRRRLLLLCVRSTWMYLAVFNVESL
jgi:hypothetical protein